jgi:hypothetical protein
MYEVAPDHFHHIWRAGHVNAEVALIQLVDDLLELANEFFAPFAREKDDEIARFAVVRDEEPMPERARHCIREIFRPGGEALDRRDFVDRSDFPGETIDAAEVLRRGNIAGRNGKD